MHEIKRNTVNNNDWITIIQIVIVWFIANTIGVIILHAFGSQIEIILDLDKLPADIKPLSKLILQMGAFILSLIIAGVSFIKISNAKIRDEMDSFYKNLNQFMTRDVSVLEVGGNSKGSLVYFIEPRIPVELMTLGICETSESLEILSIDHFQDVLLNEAYMSYFFRRANSQASKKRLIVTRNNPSFLHNYLIMCWNTGHEVWVVNKERYIKLVDSAIKELSAKQVESSIKRIMMGNPTFELNREKNLINVRYKGEDSIIIESNETKDSLNRITLQIALEVVKRSFKTEKSITMNEVNMAIRNEKN